MLPEFKRNYLSNGNTIYKVGEVEIKPDAACDCGEQAKVLATFQILLPPGAESETDRDGIGALLLCEYCAYELQRLDARSQEPAHYMTIESALLHAKYKNYGRPTERKEYRLSGRWKEIIKWMSNKGSATGVEIYNTFGMNPEGTYSQLNQLAKKGIIERHGTLNNYIYTVVVQESVMIC